MNPVGSTQAVPVAPDDEVPPEEENNRTAWLVALLVVLAVALGIIAYFLVSELGNTSFAMPDVVHQQVATATTVLQEKGLVVDPPVEHANHEARGTVLASTPKATASVKKGDKVVLTVSSGPAPVQKVAVPTVVGSTLASAEAALANTHLKSKVSFVSSNKPATTVISQTPVKGHLAPVGSTVTLTVPKSSSTVGVPNVTGLSPTQAKGALAAQTLATGSIGSACSNSFGKGLVAGSTPPTGSQVAKGSPVALTVSSGPCQAPLPNVLGSSLANATSTLTQQGFSHVSSVTTANCTPRTRGAVIKQTPTAGTNVPTSSQVTLEVCSAVPTTTPTTSTTTTTAPSPTTTTTPVGPHTKTKP
jgi:serine/threonine-protein kinase